MTNGGINYSVYRPEVADDLIQIDNTIDKAQLELKKLHERKKAIMNDPDGLKNIDNVINYKKADLRRFKQARNDILRGYE